MTFLTGRKYTRKTFIKSCRSRIWTGLLYRRRRFAGMGKLRLAWRPAFVESLMFAGAVVVSLMFAGTVVGSLMFVGAVVESLMFAGAVVGSLMSASEGGKNRTTGKTGSSALTGTS